MSYDNFIANHRPEEGSQGKCKHGVDKLTCAYCNGDYEKTQKRLSETKREKSEWNEWKQKYDELRETFSNCFEDWKEEEVQLLYDKMKGLTSIRGKRFSKIAYEVAVSLGRTRKAVVWHYKQLFVLEGTNAKSLHAGKVLVEFKKKLVEGK